jgi:copper chaperone CopZ
MSTLTLFVDEMACRRCVREVSALLRDVPGVETVAADAQHHRVTLTGSMTAAQVLAAFATTPFTARTVHDAAAP